MELPFLEEELCLVVPELWTVCQYGGLEGSALSEQWVLLPMHLYACKLLTPHAWTPNYVHYLFTKLNGVLCKKFDSHILDGPLIQTPNDAGLGLLYIVGLWHSLWLLGVSRPLSSTRCAPCHKVKFWVHVLNLPRSP